MAVPLLECSCLALSYLPLDSCFNVFLIPSEQSGLKFLHISPPPKVPPPTITELGVKNEVFPFK